MLTGAQIRMARGYMRWSVRDLAEVSGVSIATIKRMEEAEGVPTSLTRNLHNVHRVFESAGLEFTSGDGGVRPRKELVS